MAFRQPTFAPTTRPTSAPVPAPEQPAFHPRPTIQRDDLADSREWVLFPSRESAASYTHATSTDRTPRTAGLSHLSDFGSLNTAARSGQTEEDLVCEATNGSLDEEDEGLDSLDDGLHAFQEPSKLLSEHFHASSNSILPRHDGLGSFRPDTSGLEEHGVGLLDREAVASRKRSFGAHRRRTSINMERGIQEAILEDEQSSSFEEERIERIERWRMEHSRVLLDEIEKETRRRRRSSFSHRTATTEQQPNSPGLEGFGQIIRDELAGQTDQNTLRESANKDATDIGAEEDDESFWQRFTRRVIRDFIGIDDVLLSVILGESLPEERVTPGSPPSKAPRLDKSVIQPLAQSESTWEKRLIERVTRELGILLNQFSDQPSTFGTASLFNPTTSDYAGIPITQPTSSRTHRLRPTLRSTTSAPQVTKAVASPTSFTFNPTLQETPLHSASANESSSHAALWGIEEEPCRQSSEQEYWESTPGPREILQRFLSTRFPSTSGNVSSGAQSFNRPLASTPHNIATTSTPDSLRRAALIRQHHPLTSRAAAAQHRRRRSWLRGGSSCASESARRSRVGVGRSSLSTSRNYWDLGGSSIAGSAGGMGMGGWGEV